MIYIATPYSHADLAVMELRYHAAVQYTGILMNNGHVCFSPIAYGHGLAQAHGLRTDAEYWEEFNFQILDHAETIHVLKLPGYKESVGIKAEVERARNKRLNIFWKDPAAYGIEI